jgi:hypothetical protein
MTQYKIKDAGVLDGIVTFIMYAHTHKDIYIVDDIKIRGLGWAGHIIRRWKGPKRFLMGNFIKSRPLGEPSTRWGYVFRRDTSQILATRRWRKRSEDREDLRRLLRGVGA